MPPIEWPTSDRIVEVEVLEHRRRDRGTGASVRIPGVPASSAVSAEVDRDHAEVVGQVDELVVPGRGGQREAVEEHDRRRAVDRPGPAPRCTSRRRRTWGRRGNAHPAATRAPAPRSDRISRGVGGRAAARRRSRRRPPRPPAPRPDRSGVSPVVERDPAADAAHDLVGDGVEARGPVPRADLLVALTPDEHDLVARGRPCRRRRSRP